MTEHDYNLLWLVFALIGGIAAPIAASSKHRSVGGWFLAGILFPLIALVAILCLPPLPAPEQAAS
jgi:hypothetical protein